MKRIVLALGLALAACATPIADEQPKPLRPTPLSFDDLSGWETDQVASAIPVFLRSCSRFATRPGPPVDFLPGLKNIGQIDSTELTALCHQAAMIPAMADPERAARQFFERHFTPVLITRGETPDALFTGYFEPTYPAAREAGPRLVPALGKPGNLISVDLGAFDPELSGKRILGRVEGERLIPYHTHEEIIAAAPAEAETLAFMDPTDLLFLQIQGSGRLVFPDGEVLRIGYAGKNGHKYVPVGRTLVQDGALPLEDVTMQSIRDWLKTAAPAEAARVRHSNPSYVFFTPLDGLEDPELGPLGAQGAQLTEMRSLAVDDEIYGYGLPVWIEGSGELPQTRLFIAQDTGGAIVGAQRADIYIGSGEAAGEIAGRLKDKGRMVVLLPKLAMPAQDDAP